MKHNETHEGYKPIICAL